MGAKQILRIAKLKTLSEVSSSARHTFREIPTHNANPAKASQNAHSAKNAAAVVEVLTNRLNTVKVRKNAVRCVEFLITASPEFFSARSGQAYFDASKKWLEKSFGAENVISSHVHRDEKTPHAVFYVVPIDNKGKLNARGYFGGRQKMSAMQDAFHQSVAKKFHLERGKRGSKADHETIQQYYARVNAEHPPAPTRTSLILMSEDERLETMKTLHAQAIDALAEVAKLNDEREKYTAKINHLEKRIDEQSNHEDLLRKATARLIKNTYSPADFAKNLGVEMRGKKDIFEVLVKSGQASNFAEAVALVALKMPPKNSSSSWSDLAEFAVEIDDTPKRVPSPIIPAQSVQAKRRFR